MKPEATDCTRRGELRDKVARGVAWNMAEKVGTALMQMAVSLIILRLLTRGFDGHSEGCGGCGAGDRR